MAIVFTFGIQGSASTWPYNVCRELLQLRFGAVETLYSDSTPELTAALKAVRHAVVVKMHLPDPGLLLAITSGHVPAVITIRDPRDSIVSLIERFDYTFEHALEQIRQTIARIRTVRQGRILLFRYESGFFSLPQSVSDIAGLLDIAITDAQRDEIFDKYTANNIKAFVDTFEDLPPERIIDKNGSRWDAKTMLHKTHLGDGKVGKWKTRLSTDQLQAVRVLDSDILALGYQVF